MSFDFIDAAAEQLEHQDYPYAIIHGNGPHLTAITYNCPDHLKSMLVAELRRFANLIESGEYE